MGEFGVVFQNEPVDVSEEFSRQENHFFVGDRVEEFDPESASGKLCWKSLSLKQRVSYHQITTQLEDYRTWEDLPPGEYEDDRALPFDLSFVTPRTVRLRLAARPEGVRGEPTLMLAGEPPTDDSWRASDEGSSVAYRGPCGSVIVEKDPLRLELRDAGEGLLTRSHHLFEASGVVNARPTPFSFVRNTATFHRHIAASFGLSPGEKLFGCGESFTRLDKRGQKLVLWSYDAYSAQTPNMYKPVPFFMSSRGYGVFVHTSAPLTFDLGRSHDGAAVIYLGDDQLDLFFFFGSPKEILSEYTALTGRASLPPPWTFGLWMGRQTYSSEKEVREVAKKLRQERIPSDVIHLDTGWPEVPHRCDFEFSRSRFVDPKKMLADLKEEGFRVSLWQLPYFNPKNRLHREAIEKDFVVLTASGEPPVDDAVIDLSKPEAERWYREKLARLLETGVGIFTSDFGEAAPLSGMYASRKGGFHEHNLYPLRYNRAVAGATKEVTGNGATFSRSAWAGSQRYPLHWGGDAENSDGGMVGTLRGGLSLGLCGFSFWSHFIGGFPLRDPGGPLPALAGVRRAQLAQQMPRQSSYRALGVRWKVHRRLQANGRAQVPAHALRLRPGRARLQGGASHVAYPFLRVSGGQDLLAGGGRVPLRYGYPRRTVDGGDEESRRLPSARPLERLPGRRDVRGCPLAPRARGRGPGRDARQGWRGDPSRQARAEYRTYRVG